MANRIYVKTILRGRISLILKPANKPYFMDDIMHINPFLLI